ncbi:hypothetical protein Scel_66750 [Streptomyces cellostaticus]|nr:hypothetical protein Scel_66750 [Streptomyces cellostaticus]
MARSLDGLILAPVADQAPGQVGTSSRFAYHEKDGEIWAEYAGGDVVRGHLAGIREGDRLEGVGVAARQRQERCGTGH